jgi:hypothetical protein
VEEDEPPSAPGAIAEAHGGPSVTDSGMEDALLADADGAQDAAAVGEVANSTETAVGVATPVELNGQEGGAVHTTGGVDDGIEYDDVDDDDVEDDDVEDDEIGGEGGEGGMEGAADAECEGEGEDSPKRGRGARVRRAPAWSREAPEEVYARQKRKASAGSASGGRRKAVSAGSSSAHLALLPRDRIMKSHLAYFRNVRRHETMQFAARLLRHKPRLRGLLGLAATAPI